jgi:hypothetical protein
MRYVQKFTRVGIVSCVALGVCDIARATVIDFDDVVGRSTFAAAGPAADYSVTIDGYLVVVHGGVVLTQTTYLPVDQSSVEGTATIGGPSYVDPLTVSFFDATTLAPRNINNFFLDVLNGNTTNVDYTVTDNLGNSATFDLMPNLLSGQETIGFAAAGSTITIFAALPAAATGRFGPSVAWDFFFDNVHFNEPLSEPLRQPQPDPEPGSLALIGIGLAALGLGLGKRH